MVREAYWDLESIGKKPSELRARWLELVGVPADDGEAECEESSEGEGEGEGEGEVEVEVEGYDGDEE